MPNSSPGPVNVTLSGQISREQGLAVRWRIANPSDHAIYVFDRLWVPTGGGRGAAADGEKAYRFIIDDRLLLLLDAAPLPDNRLLSYRNIPYVTRIASGTELRRSALLLPAPVCEYSVYFPYGPRSSYQDVQVQSLVLTLAFVPADPAIETTPSQFDASALHINTPGVLDRATRVSSAPYPLQLLALQRRDEFSRP